MSDILLLLVITLNLVMTSENRIQTNAPAQIVYYDSYPMLHLNMLDTLEVYHIDKTTQLGNYTIIQVSSQSCKGYIRIDLTKDRSGDLAGSVWFYKYCDHKYIERKFSIDAKKCFKLVEKYRKKKKQEG